MKRFLPEDVLQAFDLASLVPAKKRPSGQGASRLLFRPLVQRAGQGQAGIRLRPPRAQELQGQVLASADASLHAQALREARKTSQAVGQPLPHKAPPSWLTTCGKTSSSFASIAGRTASPGERP